jgi:diacylglycerol kinase family enzyme
MTITSLPASADRVLISVNPKAGRRAVTQSVQRLAATLTAHGLTVEVQQSLEQVAALANQWFSEGKLRAVVGVGGDGTAAELVNRTAEGVPITLLACGTANILAKHLGLCHRPERLCQTIVEGKLVRLDAGRVGNRIFLALFSCGFDATVVERLHHWRTAHRVAHIGYLSYIKPILESIRTYDYPAIQVQCLDPPEGSDGTYPPPATTRWVFALNLPRYGWGLRLAPGARADDGLLDVCTFDRGSLWSGLRYVIAAQLGLHPHMPDCGLQQGRRFQIRSDQPVPYQLDGDPGGELPVEVELLSDRLTLLVPSSSPVLRTTALGARRSAAAWNA